MAAAVTQPQLVDTDHDWKARLRKAGPLAVARAIGGGTIAGSRFGPCPACGAARTSSDPRPPCHEYVSDRDGTRLWRCRACKVTGDAVAFAARAALDGGEARDPAGWAAVRRWLAAAGVVDPDPADTASPAPRARAVLDQQPEGPGGNHAPLDEVGALWASSVPVAAGRLPVTGAPAVHPHALEVVDRVVHAARLELEVGRAAVGGLVRVLPGGGPSGGWPGWLPPDLTVERRLVVPAVDAAGVLRSVRFVQTAPPRPVAAAGLCGLPSGSSTLDAAVSAALDGFRVVPLYGVVDGQCTCPDGAGCPRSRHGKHPALRGWPDRATTDEPTLRSWWQARPASNVGIVTGSGLVVLDVDGPAGESSLAALVERHGPLPVTLEVRSGRAGGGRHLYFACPGWTCPTTHASRRAKRPGGDPLGAGLDVRGDGGNGLVVAPGSRHTSGVVYAVTRPVPVAVAPRWLLELVGRETAADPVGFDSVGLVHAGGRTLDWLRSDRPAPRAYVVPAESWLGAAIRRPSLLVVGTWAPSCWSDALAGRIEDGGEVVVADRSVVDRVRATAGGRFKVREVA